MALATAAAHAQAHAQQPQAQSLPPEWAGAIAGLGLDATQPGTPQATEYLWPECVPIWQAWQGVQTQWRTGMGGATGLCYAGVRAWLHECGPRSRTERAEWFVCIQAAERATLEVWAEQARQRQDQH